MDLSKDLFKELFDASAHALNSIRKRSIQPEKRKKLKDFGITEAAQLIGRTTQTLRNLEENKKIPPARIIKKGSREDRTYSLAEINKIRKIVGTKPQKPDEESPAIIGFANFKGGVGKSTTSVHAAQYFAKKGYRTLFVDLDSQASSTHTFGYIPDQDLGEDDTALNVLINEEIDIHKIIKNTYWDGLDIIPANLSLYNAELIMPTQIWKYQTENKKILDFYNRLNRALQKVYMDYDIIIFDLPPSMGMISINALYASNALIITIPPESLDFSSTSQFCKQCYEILEKIPAKHHKFIKFLITKFDNSKNAKEMRELYHAIWPKNVMSNMMVESHAISQAAANVQTLYEIELSNIPGSRKTYERALFYIDEVNQEIESLIHMMWGNEDFLALLSNARKEATKDKDIAYESEY